MNIRPDASQFEAHGKVLRFPVPPTPARTIQPSLSKYWLAGATSLLVVALGVAAALWTLNKSKSLHYTTATVTRGPIARIVPATGTVNPALTIIVGAHVSGVIQGFYCDYNTHVHAGQVCAKIDPRPYQATFDQYSAQLLRDQATLDKHRADLAHHKNNAGRNSVERKKAEEQVLIVSQDEATIKLDQALVEGAKLNLIYTDITSPIDGTVVSRDITAGQTVGAGIQTPNLFVIAADLKQMEVDTNTSESDVVGVKVGNKASVTVDAFPQRVFAGTVMQVRKSPKTVQDVVTYDAVIGIDNSDLTLAPGMTASTHIVGEPRYDVLRVPDKALHYAPRGLSESTVTPTGARQVWVLRDGTPVVVAVVCGIDDGNFTEIVQGDLHLGEQIITTEEVVNGSSE